MANDVTEPSHGIKLALRALLWGLLQLYFDNLPIVSIYHANVAVLWGLLNNGYLTFSFCSSNASFQFIECLLIRVAEWCYEKTIILGAEPFILLWKTCQFSSARVLPPYPFKKRTFVSFVCVCVAVTEIFFSVNGWKGLWSAHYIN